MAARAHFSGVMASPHAGLTPTRSRSTARGKPSRSVTAAAAAATCSTVGRICGSAVGSTPSTTARPESTNSPHSVQSRRRRAGPRPAKPPEWHCAAARSTAPRRRRCSRPHRRRPRRRHRQVIAGPHPDRMHRIQGRHPGQPPLERRPSTGSSGLHQHGRGQPPRQFGAMHRDALGQPRPPGPAPRRGR